MALEVPKVQKVQREERETPVPKEFQASLVLLEQLVLQGLKGMLEPKELLEERESQEPKALMENEVQLEKMVHEVLREGKVIPESEVTREIEAQWENLAFLDQKDLRVISEKRDQEDCAGQRDQGV